MFWSIHPDSGIQLAEQHFRELVEDAARVHRASEALAGRAKRARGATIQRATGVALVRLGSWLLKECYPFPALSRG